MSSIDNKRIEPRLLKGFRDALPERLLVRNKIIFKTTQVLESFGFLPLETPALEYAEILEGKMGDESEKLLYKFTDHGDRKVAMRYDFTVPLARVAAQYPELPKPFKRYQVGPVWRADNTQKGRYREFYQFDMDVIGTDSILADAEMLVLIQNVLLKLGVKNFIIKVNDRSYMSTQLDASSISQDLHPAVYKWLDKWDKIGEEAVMNGLKSDGLSDAQLHELHEILLISNQEVTTSPIAETINVALKLGLKKENVKFDPSIVRGLDYYTGIVYETVLSDAPGYGSVFSGGRYDGLVGRFAKQKIPAVGASIGLDRLMAAMEELGVLSTLQTTTQVYVTLFNSDLSTKSFEIAHALRQQGINIEVSYVSEGLGKQLKLAAAKNIPYAIIIGPDELENGYLVLRNLASGLEQKLTVDQVAEVVLQAEK